MPTVCKLPRLPRKPDDGAEVCDKYGNRWRFSGEQESWISRGLLQTPVTVSETADGVITPDIFDRLQKVRTFVNSGFDLKPLKIAPGRDAYWYYFRSSDKFVKFQPEGEDTLRIEVDRGRLFQVLMKQVCPGPRGEKGEIGDRGRGGRPGPAEICYEPSKIEQNRLDFSIITPTPLLGDRTDIELPNNHVPDISVRVFKVTLPRRTDGLVASKIGTKPKPGEVAVYDPLQHLAIYYHGLPAEAATFQATRDLLVKQSMGALAVNVCPIALSRILAIPIGSTVDRVPVVTVLVDPLGVAKPRVSYDRRFPVDVNKSLNTVQYNHDTGIVCGSIYLQNNLPWEGTFCVKSRQRGPDGQPGRPGDSTVRIVECSLDKTSVFATCPIITARLDCEQQAIFSICSDIVSQVCVEEVKLAANAGILNGRSALNTSFASAQMVLDDCKLIESYTLELVDDEFDELDLAHWSPQPGCVTKRHYDRHKFNWVKETDIPACDEAVKWYGPNGLVRPGKYPWYLGKAKPPEQDECCQEDFFYCPNVQVGCNNVGPLQPVSPPPPAPPPPVSPPPANLTVIAQVQPSDPPTITAGEPAGFDTLVFNSVEPCTYLWSSNYNNFTTTDRSFTLVLDTPGQYTFTVLVTDSVGQQGVSQVLLTVVSPT